MSETERMIQEKIDKDIPVAQVKRVLNQISDALRARGLLLMVDVEGNYSIEADDDPGQ